MANICDLCSKIKIEIACLILESALIAQKAGADRVELCADMLVGGITPAIEIIQIARENLSIDINVMIRPRGGNLCIPILNSSK